MWGGGGCWVITFPAETASFTSTIELLHKSSRSYYLRKKDHSYFNRESDKLASTILRLSAPANLHFNLVEFSSEAGSLPEVGSVGFQIHFQFHGFYPGIAFKWSSELTGFPAGSKLQDQEISNHPLKYNTNI